MKKIFFILCILAVNPLFAQKFEAESGTFSAGNSVKTDVAGYSGTGFVGDFTATTDQVLIKGNIATAGKYDIYIGYTTKNWGTKYCYLSVNGNKTDVTLNSATGFAEVKAVSLDLPAGENTFTITPNWTWFGIDYVKAVVNTTPPVVFDLSAKPINVNATPETQKLYAFIFDNFQKKIISGVMTLNLNDETDWLFANTGKYPVIMGQDFMNHTRNYSWIDKNAVIGTANSWYGKNGIITMSWHWRDPLKATDEFYTKGTTFDVSKIYEPTSGEYVAMMSDIDVIASYLKQFQQNKIPVLWRPLHEAAGGWFWWGAKGPDACKKLWRAMYDRLVNFHGLNNLIWVWTTDVSTSALNWYPGDDVVDIIGMDIYVDDNNSQVLNYQKVKEIFNGKKIITLSECGPVPDPDKLVADKAGWSYFMPWYGDYTRVKNTADYWKKLLNHSYVISLDEMPDLKNYTDVKEAPLSQSVMVKCNRALKTATVEFHAEHKNSSIYLYDVLGKMHGNWRTGDDTVVIPLGDLPNGMYILNITTNGQSQSVKIIL